MTLASNSDPAPTQAAPAAWAAAPRALGLRLFVTGTTDADIAAAVKIRERTRLAWGTVVYEQWVVPPEKRKLQPQSDRIKFYDPNCLGREISRLRACGLLTPEAMVLRNVEDGHPADSDAALVAHQRYAADLRALCPGNRRAAYGTLKRNVYGTATVSCATPPSYRMDVLRADAFATSVSRSYDTDELAEFYLSAAIGGVRGAGAGISSDVVSMNTQRAWLLDLAARTLRAAGVSPTGSARGTIALVNPWYSSQPLNRFELQPQDAACVLQAASLLGELGLWAHIGEPSTGGKSSDDVNRQVDRWVGLVDRWPSFVRVEGIPPPT